MMTAEQLKNSILQLAMQGKLVEQRLGEGTGEELFKEIQVEKKKLIKEKRYKVPKPQEDLAESELPFDIPDNWRWCQVGDFFSNASGLSYKKGMLSEKSSEMVRILRGGNIGTEEYFFREDDQFIKKEYVDDALYLKKGYMITPAVTSLNHIGKIGLIEQDYTDVVAGGFVLMLMPYFDNDIISRFLLYWFDTKEHRDACRGITHKSGQAFYNLSREKLMNLPVPLPPLSEQKRIVAKIEELMPFVEQYAAASTKLNTLNASFPEMMKKSILQEAVQGKLVPQDPNDEPASLILKKIAQKCIIPSELENEINDNYRYAHLVDACLGIYDCPHSTPTYSETFQGYLCLRTRELEVGEIKWDKLLYLTEDTYKERITRYRPKKGDIVYAREGRYGICAVIDRDTPLALGQRLMVFSVNHEILRSKYLFYVLISDFCLKQVTSAQRGMTAAHVNVKDIKKMIVPIPSLKTQDAVISVLDKLLNKIDLLKVKSNE